MTGESRLDGLVIRQATTADDAQVLQLMRTTHGWRPEDPDEALFQWKHRDSPFGPSPAWVALDGDDVVGYRTFLRWEFLDEADRVVRAVRAVDTATAESYRGRGIFRALTLRAVGELTLAGVDMVFNTPNDQSRPGYLKMGWSTVGRLPVGTLPSGPRSLQRMLQAKVPAQRWSEPCMAGLDAAAAFSDHAVAEAVVSLSPRRGFRTRITPEYLAWRTSLEPLHYRVLMADPLDPGRGAIVFRTRRRGEAVEAALIQSLVPDRRTEWNLIRRMLRETNADYVLGLRAPGSTGLIPLPGQGPVLTARPLASTPPPHRNWTLTLGDVELF